MPTITETFDEEKTNQWIKQTGQLLQTLSPEISPATHRAAMQNISSEGEKLLGGAVPLNVEQVSTINLLVADALANLALSGSDAKKRSQYLDQCFQHCDAALEAALKADSSGLVCDAAAHATTLLVSCGNLIPEEEHSSLESRAKKYTTLFEQYLDYQAIDRQLGAKKLKLSYSLASCLEEVEDPVERRILLEEAASSAIEAGEYFMRARDWENFERVQADLNALQISLNDPAVPLPDLVVFKIEVEDGMEEYAEGENEAATFSPPPPQPVQETQTTRRSPFRWIFPVFGMLFSCASLMIGGSSLYSGLANLNPVPPTENAVQYQTRMAVAVWMTELASTSFVPSTSTNPVYSPAEATRAAVIATQTALAQNMLALSTPKVVVSNAAAQPAINSAQTNSVATSCPSAPPSRLRAGVQATVGDVGGYSLTVYAQAGYNSQELNYLKEGAHVLVVTGPTCLGNQAWWEISLDQGDTGWAPETSETGAYLLNP